MVSWRGLWLATVTQPLLADAESVPERFSAEFAEADLTANWGVIARSRWSSDRGAAYRDPATKQSSVYKEIATPPTAPRTSSPKGNDIFEIIFSFATLHHIPSHELRLDILKTVHGLLADSGRFIHSNWQFLNSPRLRQRVQQWSEIGLTESDVDENDYLLDWRSGGTGLRYVHHFSEAELVSLAVSSGFEIVETFYSDGKEGNLAIYQVWQKS